MYRAYISLNMWFAWATTFVGFQIKAQFLPNVALTAYITILIWGKIRKTWLDTKLRQSFICYLQTNIDNKHISQKYLIITRNILMNIECTWNGVYRKLNHDSLLWSSALLSSVSSRSLAMFCLISLLFSSKALNWAWIRSFLCSKASSTLLRSSSCLSSNMYSANRHFKMLICSFIIYRLIHCRASIHTPCWSLSETGSSSVKSASTSSTCSSVSKRHNIYYRKK